MFAYNPEYLSLYSTADILKSLSQHILLYNKHEAILCAMALLTCDSSL